MIAIANKQLTDNAAGRMLYFFHVRIDDDRSLRDHPRFAPWQPIRPINQQSNLGISNPTWAPSSLVLSSARGRWLPSIWPSPTGTRTTVEDAKSRSASESRRVRHLHLRRGNHPRRSEFYLTIIPYWVQGHS